jgi:hypothetical protein
MGGDVTFVDEGEIVKEDLRTQGLGPTMSIKVSPYFVSPPDRTVYSSSFRRR